MIPVKKQDKKILILIIVILIILAIFIIIRIQNRKISCSEDKDCVLVKNDCCGCESGGSSITINKKYQASWISKIEKQKNCQNILCAAVYNCQSQPRCIENKCQIPMINKSVESTGIRLGITSPSTELAKNQEKTIQYGIKNIFNKNTTFNFNVYSEQTTGNEINFEYPKIIELKPGDYKIQEIKIKTSNIQSGTYNFILTVCEGNVESSECKKESESIYAFSGLTINVKE